MFNPLTLKEVNQLASSLTEESIKDPTLKAKIKTLNQFEIYQITFKAVNQGQSNIGIVGFDKTSGEVMRMDPDGIYAPVKMFIVKNKEQLLRVMKEKYEDKGADVKRIK